MCAQTCTYAAWLLSAAQSMAQLTKEMNHCSTLLCDLLRSREVRCEGDWGVWRGALQVADSWCHKPPPLLSYWAIGLLVVHSGHWWTLSLLFQTMSSWSKMWTLAIHHFWIKFHFHLWTNRSDQSAAFGSMQTHNSKPAAILNIQ